ncbi:hypothetical protein [Aestuariibaculum lutulentum]|uniref:Uncharacterized protein n=1 Tax=Aestuariibaculum lutulentum TaxID=2920935 RepID=A0ABS9RJQ3_9FLAO|nr:hypothetical protein [Aestuariibaculum lutulentum]MCH4553184.1 hypothetical protein [Aestuariibaculum lutulentum]
MTVDFIELSLGSHMISHGYDAENNEVLEHVVVESFSKKVVAISRIKSVSEKYILTDYTNGRWIYWEYEEDYDYVKKLLVSLR